jgi:serine/threonine protein phosphatase PrpC
MAGTNSGMEKKGDPGAQTLPGQPSGHPGYFDFGAATDIGRKRQQNQDSMSVVPELGLFLVADGMGGHRGGEIASQMAADAIPQAVRALVDQAGGQWDPKVVLSESIRAANDAIFVRAIQNSVLQGMGTTTTALLFRGDRLTIGHVGDSRCYYFRPPGLLWQATRDHSLVQEKLRAGLITRSEVRSDRMKNVITRSVGFEREVNVETYEMRAQPGDSFMICSDGLSGLINDEEIRALMYRYLYQGNSTEMAVNKLIEAANNNGGDDNITAIVIRCLGVTGGARA